MDKAKAQDLASSGLIANTSSAESLVALGRFTFECIDSNGKIKWVEETPNLVVNVGLQYMAGTSLDGATARITTWYVGLKGSGTPAAGDTLASHGTWSELAGGTAYTGTRPAATFAAATTANPSVVTNSASKASFAIIATNTVAGAFLCSVASGTSGTLFSASDFTGGSRSVVNGDTLQVTYTFSLSA